MSYNSFLLSLFQNNFENSEIGEALINANIIFPFICVTVFFIGFLLLSIISLSHYFFQRDKIFLSFGLCSFLSFLFIPYSTAIAISPNLQVAKKDMVDTNYFNSLSDDDKAYFSHKMETINEFNLLQVGDEITVKEALTGNFDGKYSSKIYLADLDKVMTEIKNRHASN